MPIAKITKGSSALGCLEYVLEKAGAELLETNCDSETPNRIQGEFNLALEAHQRNGANRHREQYVFHTSIAFPVGCDLTQETQLAIAHKYLQGMGFTELNQYVIAAHHDTEHPHLHVIANRVGLDGQAVSVWRDWERAGELMSQIEVEYNLPQLRHGEGADIKAPTVAEVRQSRKSGNPIPRQVLQETIERCLTPGQSGQSLHQVTEALKAVGVDLIATQRDDGRWALIYQLEIQGKRRSFSASKLGKRYTQKGLQSSYSVQFGDALSEQLSSVPETPALPTEIELIPVAVSAETPVGNSVSKPQNAETPSGKALETSELESTTAQPNSVSKLPDATEPANRFETEPGKIVNNSETKPTEGGFVGSAASATSPEEPTAASTTESTEGTTGNGARLPPPPPTVIEPTVATVATDPEAPGAAATKSGIEHYPETVVAPGTIGETTAPGQIGATTPEAATADPTTKRIKTEEDREPEALTATAADQSVALALLWQWTQTHIETLEAKAVWIGLQNATAQEQWETLAAQAQQRGINQIQQVELYVSGLACQQGYSTPTIVHLLQQSPRVRTALDTCLYQKVHTALTQSVEQVRQELARRERAAQQQGNQSTER